MRGDFIKTIKELKKRVCVTMPLELYDALVELAREDARSLPGYVRWVLKNEVNRKKGGG